MTRYRLYLRSRIRRELLAPEQVRLETKRFAPSPAGRMEHPSMICGDLRYSYVIAGCEAFEAQNDAAAMAIARNVFDAAGDLCDAFNLWDGTRQIDQSRIATLPTSAVVARRQNHVVRVEETLLNRGWAIAHSQRLLARFNELRNEAAGSDPVPPPTAPC